MIRCFILDDEQHAIDNLKKHVEQTPFLLLAGSATSGFDLLAQLDVISFDLLFLDIHMPGISGLELLKIIKKPIILTTAYSEYALDGFEHDVIDYLLKPITYARFVKAAHKAATVLKLADTSQDSRQPGPDKDYLFINGEHKGKQIKINFSEIDYVEGAKNYAIFHCSAAKRMAVMSLKDVEQLLPEKLFTRIHNSYIISIKQITAIDGNQLVLKKIKDATSYKLPIGTTYKLKLLELIK